MKDFVTWLIIFSVLAGLGVRALAEADKRSCACPEMKSHCCESERPPHPSHDHDGGDCPLDSHHHHGCCFYTGALAFGDDAECRLRHPSSSCLGFCHEGEIPPDAPFLGLEKPPLI